MARSYSTQMAHLMKRTAPSTSSRSREHGRASAWRPVRFDPPCARARGRVPLDPWVNPTLAAVRGNIERFFGPSSYNFVDAMVLDGATANTIFEEIGASTRDVFPKLNLYGGYLGDAHPLCTELPRRPFLRRGARFSYIGSNALPKLHRATESDGKRTRLTLEPGSALYRALCNAWEPGGSAACRFRSTVELAANLPCHGVECEVTVMVAVKVRDELGSPLTMD